ncbi:ATP synthase subunit I [Ideonella livida]|uniref:ATP synthase subunit I n=1 Tax=Ideonella livida TaxID=2707176 RepID=A0A7C9PGM8_9BURK|nr:ATP synthase subunit I [Ideonella livida]NDY90932.1 ATP synthase subunit I [Ideonella livida]
MSVPPSPTGRRDGWQDTDDADDSRPFKVLSRQEAQALAAASPSVSPWKVVVVQVLVGVVVALCAGLWGGQVRHVLSALYGAWVVVVPAAWVAWKLSRRRGGSTPALSVVSFMLWEVGKIAFSVAMLGAAPWVVPDLSWPALLVALVMCLKVYWVALKWRGPKMS